MRYVPYIFGLIIGLASCIEIARPYTELPPGIWRAELEVAPGTILPFNFEVTYDKNEVMSIDIINGQERIAIPEIAFGKNDKLLDTLRMNFPVMDSYIRGIYKENVIEGYWTVNYRDNYRVPFVAYYGQNHRFTQTAEEPIIDVTGLWQASFEIETPTEYPAIGEFTLTDNQLSGTFLTETGDYRYLDGEVQGDQFMLSCFDGSHAFLFTADINANETMLGKFYSGAHYQTNWAATKDANASLTDPYDLSAAIEPSDPVSFTLPSSGGNMISLDDDKFAGKPKLLKIMGTWCPNCLDESKFLLDYLKRNPEVDIPIIAIAFERYRQKDKAITALQTYKERLNIPYDIVYGGYYDKKEATKSLGFIDEIISYPTLIFLDKENRITKIHTGFAGPATSKYEDFVKSFDEEINRLTQ